ncbi:MAG: archaeoflavoprotein AfpA [Candidatus Lokiarchaeota archaeon]|nr:archaeoflavoprotein AfpA [Candidatus Lokiarchaeota archaeon]
MNLITLKIAWGITGSGDKIKETIDAMLHLFEDSTIEIDVFISKAGKQVLHWYKLWDRVKQAFDTVKVEVNANVPFIAGPLQVGKYDLLVVAPLTANSSAKIAYGIEDTLLTNAVAQTLKGSTRVILFPVDQFPGTITTLTPDEQEVKIRTRAIDLENVEKLRKMEGVTVVSSINEVVEIIDSLR